MEEILKLKELVQNYTLVQIFSVAIIGVFVFYFKQAITNTFKKQLEEHKNSLEKEKEDLSNEYSKELEKIKADLSKANNEDLERLKADLSKENEAYKDSLEKQNQQLSREHSEYLERLKADLKINKEEPEYIKMQYLKRLFDFNYVINMFLRKNNIQNLENELKNNKEDLSLICEKWSELMMYDTENEWAVESNIYEMVSKLMIKMGEFRQMIDELIIEVVDKIDNYSEDEFYTMYLNFAKFKKTYREENWPLLEELQNAVLGTKKYSD